MTAAAKMRSSATMSISFSGQRAETLVMRKDKRPDGPELRQAGGTGEPDRRVSRRCRMERLHGAGRGLFREDVPADAVLDFLQGFEVSPRVLAANPENIVRLHPRPDSPRVS